MHQSRQTKAPGSVCVFTEVSNFRLGWPGMVTASFVLCMDMGTKNFLQLAHKM